MILVIVSRLYLDFSLDSLDTVVQVDFCLVLILATDIKTSLAFLSYLRFRRQCQHCLETSSQTTNHMISMVPIPDTGQIRTGYNTDNIELLHILTQAVM